MSEQSELIIPTANIVKSDDSELITAEEARNIWLKGGFCEKT